MAHAHAVRVLRSLGRELVAGSWSPDAEPMSGAHAVVVIGRAFATVVDAGVASVADALDEKIAQLLGGG